MTIFPERFPDTRRGCGLLTIHHRRSSVVLSQRSAGWRYVHRLHHSTLRAAPPPLSRRKQHSARKRVAHTSVKIPRLDPRKRPVMPSPWYVHPFEAYQRGATLDLRFYSRDSDDAARAELFCDVLWKLYGRAPVISFALMHHEKHLRRNHVFCCERHTTRLG